MQNVRVKFLKNSGKYNQGDIAGFVPGRAKFLVENGIAAVDGDGVPTRSPGAKPASLPELDALAAQQTAEHDKRAAALAAREAGLDDREAALNARAAELDAKADTTPPKADGKKAQAGAPPAQGKK